MPSIKISKELNSGIYFLTFTIKNWYYIFDRHNRFQILSDSIQYCQKNKDLKLYAYVFMLNHIHLIASSSDMIAFVRDFKKFTSKEILKNIIATEPSILKLFQIGENKYEFWQKTNMPKQIESEKYFLQKVNYIQENPVRKQYVTDPAHWHWSSANPQSIIRTEAVDA
ncbi:MAG: transposase [Candidatus Pacebacteria bacterium]|nr:transposase [Candidatus Paceibacterota bacterium]